MGTDFLLILFVIFVTALITILTGQNRVNAFLRKRAAFGPDATPVRVQDSRSAPGVFDKYKIENQQLSDLNLQEIREQYSEIFAALWDIAEYITRDFIDYWWQHINQDQQLPDNVREMFDYAFAVLIARSSAVDWPSFVAKYVVTNMKELFRIYRITEDSLAAQDKKFRSKDDQIRNKLIMEEIKRRYKLHIAVDPAAEKAYLRKVSECLLSQIVRESDFECSAARTLGREIIANNVLHPVMQFAIPYWLNVGIVNICDPDFWKTEEPAQPDELVLPESLPEPQPEPQQQPEIQIQGEEGIPEISGEGSPHQSPESPAPLDTIETAQSSDTSFSPAMLSTIDIPHPSTSPISAVQTPQNGTEQVVDNVSSPKSKKDEISERSRAYLTTRLPRQTSSTSNPEEDDSAQLDSVKSPKSTNSSSRKRTAKTMSIKLSTSVIQYNPRPYVVYRIDVVDGQFRWSTGKRYTDFGVLQNELKKSIPSFSAQLPKKVLFGNFNPTFIETRRLDLERYLQVLMWNREVLGSDILTKFLLPSDEREIVPIDDTLIDSLQKGVSTFITSIANPSFNFDLFKQRQNEEIGSDTAEIESKDDFQHETDQEQEGTLVGEDPSQVLNSSLQSNSTPVNRQRRNSIFSQHGNHSEEVADCPDDNTNSLEFSDEKTTDTFNNQSITVTWHSHPLQFGSVDEEWICALSSRQPDCLHNIELYSETTKTEHYSCLMCNYHLCHICTHTSNAEETQNRSKNMRPRRKEQQQQEFDTTGRSEKSQQRDQTSRPRKKLHFKTGFELRNWRQYEQLTTPLYAIVGELFVLSQGNILLKNTTKGITKLIEFVFDGFVDRWYNQQVDSFTAEESVVSTIKWGISLVWPDGQLVEAGEAPGDEEEQEYANKSLDRMLNAAPKNLINILGKPVFKKGLTKLWLFFQLEPLVKHMGYALLDSLLCTLFPTIRANFPSNNADVIKEDYLQDPNGAENLSRDQPQFDGDDLKIPPPSSPTSSQPFSADSTPHVGYPDSAGSALYPEADQSIQDSGLEWVSSRKSSGSEQSTSDTTEQPQGKPRSKFAEKFSFRSLSSKKLS